MKTCLSTRGIFCGLFAVLVSAQAQSWTSSNSSYLPWTAITASADGTRIWAALTNGPVFFSTNSGSSWGVVHWENPYYTTALASSADETVLVAATGYFIPGPIYVSTDSGATWPVTSAPNEYWTSIACSADGSHLVAAATNGAIYISTNTGAAWFPSGAPAECWVSITSSADGSQLAAVATNGVLCVSTNGGITWMTNIPNGSNESSPAFNGVSPNADSAAPDTNWQAVACSADKSRLVAIVNGGPIYISTNAGSTWVASSAPSASWAAVAASADGTTLIAGINKGPIYTSTNAGATWFSNNIPGSPWISVTSSADGKKLAAAAVAGFMQPKSQIYTLQLTPEPQLNLSSISNQVGLSWILPSTNFVLQENLDLTTTNWVTLTNAPVLNLVNLNDEVVLPQTNSGGFFRLISQ